MAAAAVPSIATADIEAFVSAIDQFASVLAAASPPPQQAAMKRLPRPRKSAATVVPTVTDLSKRYGVESSAFPIDAILANQSLVGTLAPVLERISAVQKLVGDVSFVAQSGAWEGAMVNYGLLKSEARGNAVLRKAIQPVRNSMRATYTTEDGTQTVVRSKAAPKAKKPPAVKVAPQVTVDPTSPTETPAPSPTEPSNAPSLAGPGASKT